MGYVEESKRKWYLMAGFIGMMFCGVGDCLLAFMGEGAPYVFYGMISMNVSEVPMVLYQVSFLFGIIAAIGYLLGSKGMYSYVKDRVENKNPKLLKVYTFGAAMMSIGIFGIHAICCLAMMNIQAAVRAGLSAEAIEQYFTAPDLYPFILGTTWQTVADVIVGITFIIMVCKKIVNVSKAWIVIGPLCLYVLCHIIAYILVAVTGNPSLSNFLAGGETWGLGFMFLAVRRACDNKMGA